MQHLSWDLHPTQWFTPEGDALKVLRANKQTRKILRPTWETQNANGSVNRQSLRVKVIFKPQKWCLMTHYNWLVGVKMWLCPRISKASLSYVHGRAVWGQVCECAPVSPFRSRPPPRLQDINQTWALSSLLWCWSSPGWPHLPTSPISKYCLSCVSWAQLLWATLTQEKHNRASSLPRHISLHFKEKEIVSGIGNWSMGLCRSKTCGEGRGLIFFGGKSFLKQYLTTD